MEYSRPRRSQNVKVCSDCRLNFGPRLVEYISRSVGEGERYEAPDIDIITQSRREGCQVCTIFRQQIPKDLLRKLHHTRPQIYVHWSTVGHAMYLRYFFYPRIENPEADPDGLVHDIADIQTQLLPSSGSILISSLESSTGSDRTFSRIQSWLKECKEHPVCSEWQSINQVRKALPTRLIDVDDMRLRCEDDLPHRECQYMTLSHSWGQRTFFQLRRENLLQCQDCLFWEDLPRTFKDAIIIVQSLGIRYLWIDALCIIQDSEEDWIHEASRMDQVYSNSFLNISAADSEDGEGGILRLRDAQAVGPVMIATPELTELGKRAICYCEEWQEDVDGAPLNSRAWVVQERFLAPRVVHFGRSEVYWECITCKSMESLPPGLTLPGVFTSGGRIKGLQFDFLNAVRNRDAKADLHDLWDELVSTYCDGALTFSSDRPIAIMGLARSFCNYLQLTPGDYCAGLWKPHMELALMWKRYCTSQNDDTPWPSDLYVCSWSWLHEEGSVIPGRVIHGTRFVVPKPVVEVLEASTVPIDNPFGPIRSGIVRVRAPLCKVSFDLDSSGEGKMSPLFSRHVNADAEYGLLKLGGDTIEHLSSYEIRWDRCVHHRSLPIWNGHFYLLLGKVATFHIPDSSPDRDVARAELENLQASAPAWGVGQFECLILTPTRDTRGQFLRMGYIHFFDQEERMYGRTSEASRMVQVSQTLNKHFRSPDVEEDMYEDVGEDFMYTVTLV